MIKYEILDKNKNIIKIEEEEKQVIKELTTLLFNKYVVKADYIKAMYYKYNYSDKQQITFKFNNGYKTIFYNIPTNMGHLSL